MSFVVNIRQHPDPVVVEPGGTVLESALAQGVPYPHGCRSGNCGACKSRLESGEVELSPYSPYALSNAERAQGLILVCRVAEVAPLTHDIRRVRLAIESGGPFTFSAGQYASLRFAGLPPRDYSMANRPDEPMLEFHVRRMGPGSTSAYVAERLTPGEEVIVEGPYGSSWLRDKHAGPIVAVAGGSGLAPIKAIVETALSQGMRQPIHLYFGVRDERDIYLEAQFRALAARHENLRYTPVLSQPSRSTARRVGLVHEVVAGDLADLDGAKAYLAGPPPMVEAATALLVDRRGMRRQDVHADAFYTEAEKAALNAHMPEAAAVAQ